jgi:hypothetical protein
MGEDGKVLFELKLTRSQLTPKGEPVGKPVVK